MHTQWSGNNYFFKLYYFILLNLIIILESYTRTSIVDCKSDNIVQDTRGLYSLCETAFIYMARQLFYKHWRGLNRYGFPFILI